MREITNGSEGLLRMKKGVDILADAVKVTLGPKGRNVILSRGEYGLPHVTKDGVTVANDVEIDDKLENMGAQLVKEVASQVAEIAGDGTTTATILTQSIIAEGYKMIVAGANPMDLKRGIDKAVKQVVQYIQDNAQNIDDKIENIATISSNNDEGIGKLIAEAFSKVGNSGMILLEDSHTSDTKIKIIDGFQVERGYFSPFFIDNLESNNCILEDAYILVLDDKISDIYDLLPLLDLVAKDKKPLLIICEDLDPVVLQTLLMNKMNGIISVCVIKSPGFGDSRRELLEDLSIVCGAELISKDFGHDLKTINLSFLGSAKKIVIDKDNTKIIEGSGDKEDIDSRMDQLKSRILKVDNYEADRLKKRVSDLSGGVAIIQVGAFSEIELKEKRDRIEDSLKAVRSAIEEGIVPGGGVAYLSSQSALDYSICEGDEHLGMDIIKKTLEYPIKLLCGTLGTDAYSVMHKIREAKGDFGFNMKTEEFEDSMIDAGIIDPAKVIRVALEKAASIAGTLLTTSVVISYK